MNIESLDLNLLLAFEALIKERSVSRGGKRIGLSQPAMSNALARLRAAFSDSLFVWRGREMVPTARASQISGPVLQALSNIRSGIGDRERFDAKTASMTFRIAATDYAEVVFLPRLLWALQRTAPNIHLSVSRLEGLFEIPTERLHEGSVHMALGLFPQPVVPGKGIASQLLFDEEWVGIVRRGHPCASKRLPLSRFLKIEHIRVDYCARDRSGLIGEALASIGKTRRIAVTVQHLVTVPFLAARTDLLGIVPRRLAEEYVSSLKLQIYPIPLRLPRTPLALLWNERKQEDPAHRWLREAIHAAASGPQGRRSSTRYA